jgi:hypothetical protein
MEADQIGRLRDILNAARLIGSYVSDTTESAFRTDTQKQDAVVRRLEIIGVVDELHADAVAHDAGNAATDAERVNRALVEPVERLPQRKRRRAASFRDWFSSFFCSRLSSVAAVVSGAWTSSAHR